MAIIATFFEGEKGQENGLDNILELKNPFLGYKKRSLKSQKIDIFPMELTHGFGPKMAIFPTFFFFRQYTSGKCLL